jgi:hypothetical protein
MRFSDFVIFDTAARAVFIHYSIDVPSQEIPDEQINSYYRSGTPEANAAVQQELLEPARDAVNWLRTKGWIDDPTKIDDYVQDVVLGMLNRTGSVPNWHSNIGFRRATASMLARRFASQGWPSATKERTGHLGRGQGQAYTLDTATGVNRQSGEDACHWALQNQPAGGASKPASWVHAW